MLDLLRLVVVTGRRARYNTNWIHHVYDIAVVHQPIVVDVPHREGIVVCAHDRGLAPMYGSLLSVLVRDDKLFLCAQPSFVRMPIFKAALYVIKHCILTVV